MGQATYALQPLPSLSYFRSPWIWTRLVALARATVCNTLEQTVKYGIIEVVDCDNVSRKFGTSTRTKNGPMEALLYVHDETFWVRVYLSYDVGFSEAYMNGEFTTPSLKDALTLYVYNFRRANVSWSLTYNIKVVIDVIIHRFLSHGFKQSIDNVAGYDASNDLYKAFLSNEMQYSCPIWLYSDGGPDGDLHCQRSEGDLERAQARKIQWVLEQARIKPGHRVLEIGTGWGSLAIAAARAGCTVDSLTLSIEQKVLAEERITEAGLTLSIRVHLLDYRQMPSAFMHAFDACISLEMIEAVGVTYMPKFIQVLDWALKEEDAAVVLSATAYPDSTFTEYQSEDFIRKYHWPHTIPPSATWLAAQFQAVGRGRFVLDSISNHSSHYCRCLREWGRRLNNNWTPTLICSLQKRYPEFEDIQKLERYKRRWLYMYVYMEVAYASAWLKLQYWTFTRDNCVPIVTTNL